MEQLQRWWLLHHKNASTDLMAIIGVVCAAWFCIAQIKQAFVSVEGVSLAQLVAFTGSMILGWWLAYNSRKQQPGRIISQQIAQFATWTTLGLIWVGVLVFEIEEYSWTPFDTVVLTCAIVGFAGSVSWARHHKRPLSHPAIKAWISISLKSMPQLFLAYLIFQEGGGGWKTSTVFAGHVSITMRLIPLSVSCIRDIRKSHAESLGARIREVELRKRWLLVIDVCNSASWWVVTFMLYMY